jgi:Electron transfer flavoprotein, alpha subunit
MKSVLVIIDTIANKAPASAFELIAFAESLVACDPIKLWVVVAGENIADAASKAARYGHPVIGLEHDDFRFPNPDFLTETIMDLIDELHPRHICLQHTMRGCQVAAQLAVDAGFACITAVESFTAIDKKPVFRRSLFNGKVTIDLSPDTEQSVVTVLPGAYAAPDIIATPRNRAPLEIRKLKGLSRYRPLEVHESTEENVKLEESDVIVSAGRGIGNQKNLDLIRAVANLFTNSAVAASRTICDLKWLPFAHQVGTTGKTVSPKLYLACGISGAQQHIAGMKSSQLIVAINKDPQAAIFSVSDYIVVEDLTTFLPLLIRKYHEMYK